LIRGFFLFGLCFVTNIADKQEDSVATAMDGADSEHSKYHHDDQEAHAYHDDDGGSSWHHCQRKPKVMEDEY
jgi:hypothetical protein